jgi:non-ribosomal peptide synthase protein (TIGR01720 family)
VGAPAEVSFNYLGQFDQSLGWATAEVGLAGERTGRTRSEEGEREYVLEVVGKVVGGELQVSWMYSRELHREETVRRLAAEYMEELQRIIRHCGSGEAGGYTPSDFPQANLSEQDLKDLLAEVSG